ncbi:hydrogenase accessory protein HypB, partial [Rhodoplanes elegans]
MCTVCGCGTGSVEGAQSEARSGAHSHDHSHTHEHPHDHVHTHDLVHADGTVHRHAHSHAHAHAHSHTHSHVHGHDHDHDHGHGHSHDHHHDHGHDALHGDHHPHDHDHDRLHADGVPHDHSHDHDHVHGPDGALDYGAGDAGVSVPGLSQARIVKIERDILAQNDAHARDNRARLASAGVFALNLVSSPGSGKTTLLVRTIQDLAGRLPVVVIEGDQQTSNDAARIRATGAPAVQINTGKGCHLDAHMVGHALEQLPLAAGGVLFVENVGNLVCPAAFDLGEAHKVVVLSVTEGEDKPL